LKPPLLDKRSRAEILDKARMLAGRGTLPPGFMGYVPEWTSPVDADDPGHRFLESFARLAELLI